MPELPVQDRSCLEKLEVLDLQTDPPATQAEPAAGLQYRQSVRSVPARARDLTHVVERDVLAVVPEQHGEAGRAAIGRGELLDERDPFPALGAFEPLDGRKPVHERGRSPRASHGCACRAT